MKPDLIINLDGPDGNIYAVLGKASKLIPKDKSSEMIKRVQESGSYTSALIIIKEYVNFKWS